MGKDVEWVDFFEDDCRLQMQLMELYFPVSR